LDDLLFVVLDAGPDEEALEVESAETERDFFGGIKGGTKLLCSEAAVGEE